MGTDVAKIIESKFGRGLVILLFVTFIIIFSIGFLSNKSFDVWGLKFNPKESTVYIHDTLYKIQYDTITNTKFEYKPRSKENIPLPNSTPNVQSINVSSNNQKDGVTAGQVITNGK